jgi:hypothetical protein
LPAILPGDTRDLWLESSFQKTDTVCDPWKPFNSALMRRYEVSSHVNLGNGDAARAVPVAWADAAGVSLPVTTLLRRALM